jgi:hypothetical protein
LTELERFNRILDRLRANGAYAAADSLLGFLGRLDAAVAQAKVDRDALEHLRVQLMLCTEDKNRAQDVIRITIAADGGHLRERQPGKKTGGRRGGLRL